MRKIIYLFTVFLVVIGVYQLRPANFEGESYSGELAPLTQQEQELKADLVKHVTALSTKIGERHFLIYKNLHASAEYISAIFQYYGYKPKFDAYRFEIRNFVNIIAEVKGTKIPNKIVVVGCNYDTVQASPGADYNATGIAAILELSRYFKEHPPAYTLRFVAFTNKEPPFMYTRNMGSVKYAFSLREKNEDVVAMYSLEGLGYFSNKRYTQRYPYFMGFFRSDVANFIAFVTNYNSQELLTESLAIFRLHNKFPSQGIAAPDFISSINASDHWAFWGAGYHSLMITDTMFYRNENYYRESDTIKTIDFDNFTRVVVALRKMLENLHLKAMEEKTTKK